MIVQAVTAGVKAYTAIVQAVTAGVQVDTARVQAITVGVQADTVGVQADTVGVQAVTVGVQADTARVQAVTVGIQTNMRLPLTDLEKANLKKNKVKIVEILNYATDELEVLLNSTTERTKEIYALAEFQTVPSIGIKFAEDLVFLGYYSLNELKDKDGAKLTDEYEQKKGYWIDPCVEDQFRLVVNFAQNQDAKKCGGASPNRERKTFLKMVIQQADRQSHGTNQLNINK
ncbi:MAG: Pathogenicity locus [Bacteroidetes bacterium]|nr:Pathogenicity locus [Bacteroidota bacterium]